MLLYATDLIFTSRIGAEARAAGVPFAIARGIESLTTRLDQAPRLVIVDLDADDAVAAVAAASDHASRPHILAFVSHVRADLAAAARAAGAREVISRSAFVMRLPALMLGLKDG